MKKQLTAILALIVVLALCACGASKPAETTAPATEVATEPSTEATTETTVAPTTEPTTEPATEPSTEPATEPSTQPLPDPPVITKNPTDEYRNEGENAIFIAYAENYNYVYWTLYDPSHGAYYDARDVAWHFDGLSVEGEKTTRLVLYNLPMEIDGWCAEATFVGDGGNVTSQHAYIHVAELPDREQLWANPSDGYFFREDLYVTLTSNPGDRIHYTIRTNKGGYYETIEEDTVSSGETIYVEAAMGFQYNVILDAYVVGDEGNCIHCVYEIDNPIDPVLPPQNDDDDDHGGFVGPVLPPKYN